MPPMKLGGSKWRPLGATVVFDGTYVVVEWTVEDSMVEEEIVLDEDVGTVVTGTSVVLVLVSFRILLPRNKIQDNFHFPVNMT